MADWLKILQEQTVTGDQMWRDVPVMLSDPEITTAQVKTLFQALEKQAEFSEQLKTALETLGYDFAIVDAAETLVERYVELAASAGERLKGMRG